MPEALRLLRRKIRTVRSIEHITRAMQFVAAAKLQKLQRRVAAGRDYAQRLEALLQRLAASVEQGEHPYLTAREPRQALVVVMAGDRGLCGAFNQQLLRAAEAMLGRMLVPVQVLTVGERAARWARRAGLEPLASYPGVSDPSRTGAAHQLARRLRALYDEEQVDEIHVVYEDFQSVFRHRPLTTQLLPVRLPEGQDPSLLAAPYETEPPGPELLAALLPQAVDALVYQMALGTQAAEQAARMTAMQAATDNAGELITGLSRRLNRARQTGITSEMLDVVSGAAATGAV